MRVPHYTFNIESVMSELLASVGSVCTVCNAYNPWNEATVQAIHDVMIYTESILRDECALPMHAPLNDHNNVASCNAMHMQRQRREKGKCNTNATQCRVLHGKLRECILVHQSRRAPWHSPFFVQVRLTLNSRHGCHTVLGESC